MLENTKISGFADEINRDIKVQVQLLKELGITYLEFRSANGKGIADYTPEEAIILKQYLDENGIKVSAIGSPLGKIKITDDFEPHFEMLQRIVEIAKIMETQYIRVFSFYPPQDKDFTGYEEEVFTRLRHMVDYAKAQKVVLLHENEKDIYGEKTSECLKLMKEFYGESFRCTFDFANFVQSKQETLEAYELLKSYVEYVHIKDARWADGRVTPAGEGDGKLEEILTLLHESGYNGFLSLEPHLSEFEGLKNLEKNPAKKSLTDGEAAFTIAYQALMKILKKIN
jgi:sugar phosphate isomerase/epimerase